MTVWLLYLLLFVVQILGLFLNLLGLPGLWLMVGSLAAFGYFTGFNAVNSLVGWPSVITVTVLAALAELGEFIAGSAGAKRAGGRKRGMFGAAIGAVVGGIFLSIIPIPILGTIIGACLGAFIGAAVAEFWDESLSHALRVGWGAAKGRAAGIAIKSLFGVAILLVSLVAACPLFVTTSPTSTTPAFITTPPPTAPAPSRTIPSSTTTPASMTTPTTLPTTMQF